jgi:hypothetical protein
MVSAMTNTTTHNEGDSIMINPPLVTAQLLIHEVPWYVPGLQFTAGLSDVTLGALPDGWAAPDAQCPNCRLDLSGPLSWADAEPDVCHCAHCDECGQLRRVVSFTSSPGFCAGSIYVTAYECGHEHVEDNSYLES